MAHVIKETAVEREITGVESRQKNLRWKCADYLAFVALHYIQTVDAELLIRVDGHQNVASKSLKGKEFDQPSIYV